MQGKYKKKCVINKMFGIFNFATASQRISATCFLVVIPHLFAISQLEHLRTVSCKHVRFSRMIIDRFDFQNDFEVKIDLDL